MTASPFGATAIERVYRTPTGEVHALHDVSCTFSHGADHGDRGSVGEREVVLAPTDRGDGPAELRARSSSRVATSAEGLRPPVAGSGATSSATSTSGRRTTSCPTSRWASICASRDGAGTARRGLDLGGMLDLLGIGDRIDHLPSELSGGEQQRAAFAQAFVSGANIIVADEPTAELDDASSEGVLDRVRALAGEGVTFLLATHDPAVMAVADERFELEHGRVKGAVSAGGPAIGGFVGRPGCGGPDPGVAPWLFDTEPVLRLRGVNKTYGEGDETVHALRRGELRGPRGRGRRARRTVGIGKDDAVERRGRLGAAGRRAGRVARRRRTRMVRGRGDAAASRADG